MAANRLFDSTLGVHRLSPDFSTPSLVMNKSYFSHMAAQRNSRVSQENAVTCRAASMLQQRQGNVNCVYYNVF